MALRPLPARFAHRTIGDLALELQTDTQFMQANFSVAAEVARGRTCSCTNLATFGPPSCTAWDPCFLNS